MSYSLRYVFRNVARYTTNYQKINDYCSFATCRAKLPTTTSDLLQTYIRHKIVKVKLINCELQSYFHHFRIHFVLIRNFIFDCNFIFHRIFFFIIFKLIWRYLAGKWLITHSVLCALTESFSD